jgi:hypothetical protein
MVATILLVAITVLLAAVLYVLIAGIGSGSIGPRPISLELSELGNTNGLPGGAAWANFSLNPSQTLTTSYFGLALESGNAVFIPAGQGNCPSGPASCSAQGGWVAFLSNPEGTIINVWNQTGWENSTVTVLPSLTLGFVAEPSLHILNSGDFLRVTSHAEPTVVGQSSTF